MRPTQARLLDGKALATDILSKLKARVTVLSEKPGLAVILVGDDPASTSYVHQKCLAAEAIGVSFFELNFPETVTTTELLAEIARLNQRPDVHGFIIQLPLPSAVDKAAILAAIDPVKDVDGFHPLNHGRTLLAAPGGIPPATPAGVVRLLDHYKIEFRGQEVVIVGHSNIVGKPLAVMLLNRDATVTVCHEFTKDLTAHTKRADILISATGVVGLIKAPMVKQGAVVVDIGCSKVKHKLIGDVDFAEVSEKVSYITPVPGGVGPMTVVTLIENVVACAEHLSGQSQDLKT